MTSSEKLREDADLEMRTEASVLEMLVLRHLQDTKMTSRRLDIGA